MQQRVDRAEAQRTRAAPLCNRRVDPVLAEAASVDGSSGSSSGERKRKRDDKTAASCKRARPNVPRGIVCRRQRHASEQRAEDTGCRYWPCTLLGAGSYGDVYQCWDAVERRHVAVKQFVMHFGDELPQPTLREVAILKRCNHCNVMPVLDTLFDGESRAQFGGRYAGGFVMPLCDGGDLGHWLAVRRKESHRRRSGRRAGGATPTDDQSTRLVPRRTQRSLARQLYAALCYLHQNSIVHRDIKPQNCMVDARGERLLLCDFGFGRQCSIPLNPTYTAEICTLWYRPPELLLGSRSYGAEVDLWSAGLTVAEMLLGRPLLPGDNDLDQLMRIFALLGTPNSQVWPGVERLPEYKPDTFPNYTGSTLDQRLTKVAENDVAALDLLRSTLRYPPNSRLSAKRALRHPFLDVDVPPPHTTPNDARLNACSGSNVRQSLQKRQIEAERGAQPPQRRTVRFNEHNRRAWQ